MKIKGRGESYYKNSLVDVRAVATQCGRQGTILVEILMLFVTEGNYHFLLLCW